MLETAEERIRLLKAGYTGKAIEELYIESNNLKVAHIPTIIELVEFDISQNKETCINHRATVYKGVSV